MGEQSNEQILPLLLLLISFLGGIWQNGSHFMSEKEKQSPTDCWASELDGHLARAGVPGVSTPTMPSSAAATVGNNDWLYCVWSSREPELLEDIIPGSGACGQMRKVRIHKKAKTKPDTTTVPSLKAVCAEWIPVEWPRQQERPQRHLRKVSGCESGWGEKVITTSYLITTKSYKEDVISVLILWIRKQRIRGAEWDELVYPTEWQTLYTEFTAGPCLSPATILQNIIMILTILVLQPRKPMLGTID